MTQLLDLLGPSGFVWEDISLGEVPEVPKPGRVTGPVANAPGGIIAAGSVTAFGVEDDPEVGTEPKGALGPQCEDRCGIYTIYIKGNWEKRCEIKRGKRII